ncbi:MAG: hypothetical protein ACJ703_02165 [Nitrososphaera sp.]
MDRGRQGILLLDSQRGLALKQKSEELTGTIIRTRAGVGLKQGQDSCYAMILGRLFKKGTVQNSPDGSLVLVNEDNVSYRVGKSDVAVWNQCRGVTFEQLCNDVAAKIGWQVPPDVLSHLERYVNWCIWAKLIEVRDFTPDQFTMLTQQIRMESKTFKELLEASANANALNSNEKPRFRT